MRSIWAVARNTVSQAFRLKIVTTFILLMLVLIPVMALSMSGDGTIKGQLQSFITYSLSLVSLLLSILTIIVATYSLADDIKQKRIFTVLTKPIRRCELLIGKFLGVICLNAIILVPITAIIYGITLYMPAYHDADDQAIKDLKSEFYTARASLTPKLPDVRDEVRDFYKKLQKEGLLPEKVSYKQTIRNITNLMYASKQAVGGSRALRWEFENISLSDPNQSVFVKFKYDVSVNPVDLNIYSKWIVGDLRKFPELPEDKGRVYIFERKDLIRTFHELEIPGDAVAEDGYLGIEFINHPINNTVVIFPPEDGLEVLYKAGSYTSNYIKAVLLLFLRLIFLACFGILTSSILSFPIALLACFVMLLLSHISGFLLSAIELSSISHFIYDYTIAFLVKLIPRFDLNSTSDFLIGGRLITWKLLGNVFVAMVLVKSLIVLLLSLVIFKFREIAKIIA